MKIPGREALKCCCSVAILHLTFGDPVDCSTWAPLSPTVSWSLLKLMSIELVMPSSHLILCHPLLLPLIFPTIRVFSNELALRIRWPKYRSFSCSISPSNKAYNLSSQYIQVVQLSPLFNYRMFSSSERKPSPIPLCPELLATIRLLLNSEFAYFEICVCVCIYIHIHSGCAIFYLASSTWRNLFKVHPC